MSHETFDDLGIPFPLFAAPARDAAGYERYVYGCVEQREVEHGFELGFGDAVRVDCESCGADVYLDADDTEGRDCGDCGSAVAFPDVPGDRTYVSYESLRAGDAALEHETEYGLVGWREARRGRTHGTPDLDPDGTDIETVEVEDGRVAARIDSEYLWELVRTPAYLTWEGERWPFAGQRPMVFLGAWNQLDFASYASDDDGRGLFEHAALRSGADVEHLWDELALDSESSFSCYVFLAPSSEKLHVHCDRA